MLSALKFKKKQKTSLVKKIYLKYKSNIININEKSTIGCWSLLCE